MQISGFAARALAPLLSLLVLLPAAGASQDKAGGAVGEAYTETVPNTTVRFDMVPVPAGKVKVNGAEVAVGPFWMSKIEIPWEAYDVFVFGLDVGGQIGTGKNEDAQSRPSKPYRVPGESFGHEGHPALGMTDLGAAAFAGWLSEKTGKKYRVPTEAEWEYACRANQPEPGRKIEEYAWFEDNAKETTHGGGGRKPNAFGLYDMLGNVAEWVTVSDTEAVAKGGSFRSDDADVSCATRQKQTPEWNMTDPQLPKSTWWLSDADFVGFRLVREP